VRFGKVQNVPHETDASDDRPPERDERDRPGDRDEDPSEVQRHAQMHDPESPGATIDSEEPAEPNEPG
jgi:hypothetical protein